MVSFYCPRKEKKNLDVYFSQSFRTSQNAFSILSCFFSSLLRHISCMLATKDQERFSIYCLNTWSECVETNKIRDHEDWEMLDYDMSTHTERDILIFWYFVMVLYSNTDACTKYKPILMHVKQFIANINQPIKLQP